MLNYNNEIFSTIYLDKGKMLNDLITKEIITIFDVIKEVVRVKDPRFTYCVARYIKGAPIEFLKEVILNSNSGKYIYKFARYINHERMETFVEKLIATKDAKYIYKFAKYIPDAPIEKLAKAICMTGDADFIYLFAINVPNAPIDILAKGIIATGSAHNMYYFLRDVANTPAEELIDEIVNLNGLKYIIYIANEHLEYTEYLVNKVISNNNIVIMIYLALYIKNEELKSKLMNEINRYKKVQIFKKLSQDKKLKQLVALYFKGDFETIRKLNMECDLINPEHTRKLV